MRTAPALRTAAGGSLAALVASTLPVSGQGMHSMTHWKDQGIFLAALTGVFSGDAELIRSGSVGAAYAAISALASRVLGLEAPEALIFVSRASYLGSIFLLYVLCRALLVRGKFPLAPAEAVSLGLTTLFAAANVFGLFSDIPWSHFPATFLLLVLAAILIRGGGATGAALAGFAWVLLFEIRAIEALAAAAAFALLVAGRSAGATRPGRLDRGTWLRVAVFAGGGAAAHVLTAAVTEVWFPVLLYGTQGKDLLSLSPSLLPARLVQFLIDPCYRTLCGDVADYLPGASQILPGDFGIWRFPVPMQAPFLLGSLCGGLTAFALTPSRARRAAAAGAAFPASTAAILALAYFSATYSGSPHLKHGFIRELMAPTMLALLAFAAVWARLPGPEGPGVRWSPRGLPLILLVSVTAALMLTRISGFPRLRSGHFERIRTESSCGAEGCRFEVAGWTSGGERVPIGGPVEFPGCGTVPAGIIRLASFRVSPSVCGDQERAGLRLIPAEAGLLELPESALERVLPRRP